MLSRLGFRSIIAFALLIAGVVLLIYGLLFHAALVAPAEESDSESVEIVESVASAEREPALIKDVAIGGLRRDENGQVKKTYSGQPPAACPT